MSWAWAGIGCGKRDGHESIAWCLGLVGFTLVWMGVQRFQSRLCCRLPCSSFLRVASRSYMDPLEVVGSILRSSYAALSSAHAIRLRSETLGCLFSRCPPDSTSCVCSMMTLGFVPMPVVGLAEE